MLGAVALHEVHLLGARPDDAHLSPQDVEQLRCLVEAQAAQDAPNPGDSRVAAELENRLPKLVNGDQTREPLLCIGHHRAELVHAKRSPTPTSPHLRKNDRTGRLELDRQGDERKQRSQRHQPDQ